MKITLPTGGVSEVGPPVPKMKMAGKKMAVEKVARFAKFSNAQVGKIIWVRSTM